jgi:hypothetical protein
MGKNRLEAFIDSVIAIIKVLDKLLWSAMG